MASEPSAPLVGVLALQGDFADHERALQAAGLRTVQVRTAAQLRGLHGLVLPGGESTTMLKLLDVDGLWGPLGDALPPGTAGTFIRAPRVAAGERCARTAGARRNGSGDWCARAVAVGLTGSRAGGKIAVVGPGWSGTGAWISYALGVENA